MKFVIAMMKHETNTFSPIVTDWTRFKNWGAYFGKEAMSAYANTSMPMAAYIDLAQENGGEIVTPVAAEAMPSGIVSAEAYAIMSDAICDAVSEGCDCVLLDLHGAMVTETTPDGEGTLLERIRLIAPQVPIAVTCDFHCNLTSKMVENCTALIGYKTYPHVDMYRVGQQVGRIVIDSIEGKCQPLMVHQQLPMLAHTLRQGTDDFPMKPLIEACKMAEKQDGILAATIFGGFSLADMVDAGVSTLVVTDADKQKAREVSREIADLAWQSREDFVYQLRSLQQSMDEAKESNKYPVILLDHEDNCGSGGTQDVMLVIKEVIEQGLEEVAVAAVYDPEAVKIMRKAGVGAKITLSLGGKIAMPSVGLENRPLEVTGKVRVISDGHWTVHGPMYTGVEVDMGPTAVLDTGKVQIVVVSMHHEPWDVGVFTSVGIQPQTKKYLLLKSRIHYRAGFAAIGNQTLHCDGEGVTTSKNFLLNYQNLRRPIYPLDDGVKV